MSEPVVQFVDVTYRGLAVTRRARLVESPGEAAFLEHEAPMPVGTRLLLVGEGGTREGRVVGVIEQEGGVKGPPGMRLAFGEAEVVAARPAPEPAPAPEPEPPAQEARSYPADDSSPTEIMQAVSFPEGAVEVEAPSTPSGPVETGGPAGNKKSKRPKRKTRG